MKDIRDYLHLYMGHEVDTNVVGPFMQQYGPVKINELTPDNYKRIMSDLNLKYEYASEGFIDYQDYYCKLILRPLESITCDEKKELAARLGGISHLSDIAVIYAIDDLVANWYHKVTNIAPNNWMNACNYLLSKGFDLFGLKNAGLAIYENDKA